MGKATPKKTPATTFTVADKEEQDGATAKAAAVLRPSLNAAATIHHVAKADFGELELDGLLSSLGAQIEQVNKGNLDRPEALLVAQAHTLDALFNALTRRAVLNMGEYLDAAGTYMRLALKAQSQCRTTVEALSELKNPQPVAFVQQANIGQAVQINNGEFHEQPTRSRAEKSKNAPNELLEEKPYEPLDTRAPSPTGRADPAMATVGKIHRAEDDQG